MPVFIARKQIGNAVRLVGRHPTDYAQELQEALDELRVSATSMLPAGFIGTVPLPTAAVGDPGTEAAGWMAADAVIPQGIVSTKGDLLGFSSEPDRVPVGADASVLTADSATALGVKWSLPTAGPTGTGFVHITGGVEDAAASPLVHNPHILSVDFTLPDGTAAYVPRYFEIAAGVTLTLGADSDLEIG